MKICIAGGTGFVGRELVPTLLASDHQITILGRSTPKIQALYGNTVSALEWETLRQAPAEQLQSFDAIINLSGAGVGEKLWSAQRRKIIFNSRILATTTLAQACAELQQQGQPITLLNASAIGIYPFHQNLQATADRESLAVRSPNSFLQRVCIGWESACEVAVAGNCRVVKLRFGNILHPSGGILKHLQLPYRLGLGAIMGSGTQPFPWVSRNDVCRAINWILRHPSINGSVNLVAPERVTQELFSHAFAKHLHRPHWLCIPGKLLRLALKDMATELVLTGPDVSCEKLLETGFEFQQPTLADFFA